ncbi:MAG: LemA family protein [Chitinophagales bacterium]
MKRTWIIIGIIVLIVIIVYSSCKGTYNSMVSKSQDTQSKWGNVESTYQRRWDLYNSVVKVVQGSAQFEQQTLTAVIEARSKATSIQVDASKLSPEQIDAFQQAQNQYSGAFGRLLAVAEKYPDLQTTQAFRDFQTQIEGTENRINKARDDFNQSVQDYNTYIKSFPTNLFAGMFGFTEKGYFKANTGTANPPDFNFNSNNTAPADSMHK